MTIDPPHGMRRIMLIAQQAKRSVHMSADAYLNSILAREQVNTGPTSPVRAVITTLEPRIKAWAGDNYLGIAPSGSFAKGTANASGTDIDLYISLSPNTPNTLKEIYGTLFNAMNGVYKTKKQNVSINVKVGTYDVDLVPGRRQEMQGSDTSLYRRKIDSWTKTNIPKHISLVSNSGRQKEIRLLKLWRNQKGLDFPSFYLELTAIEALKNARGDLSANAVTCLEYLRDRFTTARVVDPANTANIISDDLSANERATIKAAATRVLSGNWEDFVK